MTEAGAKSRWRTFRIVLLLLALAGAITFAGLSWYVTTEVFHSRVRQRLIGALEKITGGRVELGSIHAIPFQLRVEVRDLTIHGREAPGDIPYAHVDSLAAQIKIISVLGAEFGFHSVDLDHPIIHIVVYPDGSTNQPALQVQKSGKNPVEQLFALSISRLSVRRGTLFWNDEQIPLDFVVDGVVAGMNYSILRRRYEGNLALGKVDCKITNYRPFSGSLLASFILGSDDIVIQSLKATSGRSKLEAHGRVGSFHAPMGEASYDITLDTAEVAAILRQPEFRGGSLKLTGSGEWSQTALYGKGKFAVKGFNWRDEYVNLRDVDLSGNYAVNRAQIALSQLQGRALGGSVAGDAELRNWLPAPNPVPKKTIAEQVGTVKLHAKDLSVHEIAGALSVRKMTLDRLHLAGTTEGSVEMRWTGSPRNAEYEISAAVAPPDKLAPGQLPLAAHASGTYRAKPGELQVSNLSITTPASHVEANGVLSSTATLKLTANTSDLREWQPLITVLHGPESLPVVLHGRATFSGTASGTLSQAVLAGNLTAEDFDVLIPASAHAAENQVHWDSLNTDLRVSQKFIALRNGELRRDDADIHFNGRAQLEDGRLMKDSPFTARVDMQQVDVHEILAILGKDYPASGTIELSLQAQGTVGAPQGNGEVLFSQAEIRGTPLDHLQSQFTFGNGEFALTQIQIKENGAAVTGDASYSWANHSLNADLVGINFSLTRIPQLQDARVAVDGFLDFKAHVAGTTEQPAVDGLFHIRNLTLDRQPVGEFTLEAQTRGADMTLTGHSQFIKEVVALDGDVHLRGDFPAHINVNFEQFDVKTFLNRYLSGHVLGASPLSGSLVVHGELKHPRDLLVTADLRDFQVDIERIKLHNDGPLRFSVAQQTLKIDQCRLVSEGTDISGGGTVQFTGDQQLDLHAEGRVNMQLLSTYNSDFTSSGELLANVSLSGSVSNPLMLGKLQVNNGSLAYIDLPSALSNINGSIVFNRNRAEIQDLTAYTGGGRIAFHGFVASYNRQLNFDLGVTGQDVRLRYPPGVSSTANMDLKFAGSSSASLLSGDITVNKLGMTPGFDFGAYLARAAQTASLPQTDPLLNRIKLDVHVVTVPELQMQTAVVRLSGDADLHLRGTAAKPVLLGRADVIEGEAYFNGTKYRMERGDVTFTSPVTTTPVLDLQATTRVRDYDITLNVNGEVDHLNITYRSEPPLPTADIIALLAFGQTEEESAQLQQSNQSAFAAGASSAILGEALNATLGNRVQRLFGVSRIKIDPQGLSNETSTTQSGPAVTIEQQVKNNLTVTYTTSVNQASQQIIQVEYNLTRNISIVALRDQNGVVSFVTKIRRRKQ